MDENDLDTLDIEEEDLDESEDLQIEEDKEEEELTPIKLKRLKNLKMFANKSDDEIREFWRNRKPKAATSPDDEEAAQNSASYNRRYQRKLRAFQEEFGIDMNNSSDAELLKSLVRHTIQQENVDRQIRKISTGNNVKIDTRVLKNLGDYQRSLMTTITDLQDKLGISRKQRKSEEVDDFPAFLTNLKERARDYWEKSTHSVRCANCTIELSRYWLNFPSLTETVQFEITCWKCREKVIYKR